MVEVALGEDIEAVKKKLLEEMANDIGELYIKFEPDQPRTLKFTALPTREEFDVGGRMIPTWCYPVEEAGTSGVLRVSSKRLNNVLRDFIIKGEIPGITLQICARGDGFKRVYDVKKVV